LIRIVADTNVYISGTFWPGLNRIVLNLARHEVLSLACSPSILHELSQTLRGKKFRLSDFEIDQIVKDVMSYTIPIEEPSLHLPGLRDPKDHFVCSLAMKSRAKYLVTGDKDLLIMKKIKKIKIVSAREFLEKEFTELIEVYES